MTDFILNFSVKYFDQNVLPLCLPLCDDEIKACQVAQLAPAARNEHQRICVNEHEPLARIMKMINDDREKLSRALINCERIKARLNSTFHYKSNIIIMLSLLIMAENFMYDNVSL